MEFILEEKSLGEVLKDKSFPLALHFAACHEFWFLERSNSVSLEEVKELFAFLLSESNVESLPYEEQREQRDALCQLFVELPENVEIFCGMSDVIVSNFQALLELCEQYGLEAELDQLLKFLILNKPKVLEQLSQKADFPEAWVTHYRKALLLAISQHQNPFEEWERVNQCLQASLGTDQANRFWNAESFKTYGLKELKQLVQSQVFLSERFPGSNKLSEAIIEAVRLQWDDPERFRWVESLKKDCEALLEPQLVQSTLKQKELEASKKCFDGQEKNLSQSDNNAVSEVEQPSVSSGKEKPKFEVGYFRKYLERIRHFGLFGNRHSHAKKPETHSVPVTSVFVSVSGVSHSGR